MNQDLSVKPGVRADCGDRYGRFKARFRPTNQVLVFYKKQQLVLKDISEAGFRAQNAGFEELEMYKFDVVFKDHSDVSGWRVRAECMWTSESDAGFKFILGPFDRALSSRIAKMHLRGSIKLLNGTEF